MQNTSVLLQLEQIFDAMLQAAKAENWAQLANLEGSARSLLLGLKSSKLPPASIKNTLQRLLECNQELIRRTKGRRDDIAFLLEAFAPPESGAHG